MATVIEAPAEKRLDNGAAPNGVVGLRLFTASEYQHLADIGVLGEDERVELIEGRIVQMAPKNVSHAIATSRANRTFNKLPGDVAEVRVQDPILLNDYSEPEPDIVLVAPPDDCYLDHHPKPKDIFLILEIAESSLAYDREVKGRLYARNGIIQYCLLNLNDRELEDYRHPGRDGYRSKQTYAENQSFNLAAFPDISIRVSELLPPVKKTMKRRRK